MDRQIGPARFVKIAGGEKPQPANDRDRLREVGRGIAAEERLIAEEQERGMTDKQQPNPMAEFDNGLAMIAKIGSTVGEYRRGLAEGGVGDEAADRMAEKLNDELMALVTAGLKKPGGGHG